MYREGYQFGAFDTLESRKEVMRLFRRLGDGVTEELARTRRARFLQSLIGDSTTGLDGKPLVVTPCSTVEAYCLFGAITGCLGVDVEKAAIKLDRLVRKVAR